MTSPEPKILVTDAPSSPYAKGELLGQERLNTLSETSNIGVTILRYFNPYGPHQFTKMAVPSIVTKAMTGQTIEIFDDGEQVRDIIFIEDTVKATLSAARAGEDFEIFNVGSGQEEIIKQCQSTSKVTHLPIPTEPQNLEVHYLIANISKITELSSWKPETSLSNGLKRLVSEHRSCAG